MRRRGGKGAGAGFVMVTGLGPRDADRLALAAQFGADLAVDVAIDDPVAALTEQTGGLADVVVDVTAKAPAAFAQAIALARPAGTVVVAGTRGVGSGAPGFSPDVVVFKELRVLGALGVDATAYRAALDLLVSGRYPSQACLAAACGSKAPRICWLPWPVNATVSRLSTECSHHDNIPRAPVAGRRGQSCCRRSGRARLHG